MARIQEAVEAGADLESVIDWTEFHARRKRLRRAARRLEEPMQAAMERMHQERVQAAMEHMDQEREVKDG